MNAFKTLFVMQLRQKIDMSSANSPKKIVFKTVFALLIFLAVMAIAYVIFFLFIYLHLFSPLDYLPVSVMSVVFLLLLVFSLITCTVSLCKTLFTSKDNQFLITFPVQPSTIYLSKVCVSFVYEMRRTFYFLMPIFIAYAVITALPWYAYLWIIFMLTVFTAFMVVFAAFVALPVYYIVQFFKRHRAVKYVVGFALLAALVVFVVWLIGLIPSDINLIRSWSNVSEYLRQFLNWFTTKGFSFCYFFAECLCGPDVAYTGKFFTGTTFIVLGVLVAGIIIFALVDLVISRFVYSRVAERQYEFNKKLWGRRGADRQMRKGASSFRYDGKRTLLDGNMLAAVIAVIIITPVTVLFINAVFAAISKRVIGDYLAMSFNVLIVLLFSTSSNVWVSSIYSRDGEALAVHKTKPVKATAALMERLSMSIMVTFLVVVPASVIFLAEAGAAPGESVLVIATELAVSLGHLFWSAEMDAVNPKPQVYSTSGAAGVNPNEVKSVALSFFLSIITMGVVLFFLMYDPGYVYVRTLILAGIFLAYRVGVFAYKSRVVYEEM
ncbi:MAG: hypothetical protein LUD47_01120 [Clostridia bacterium]|nr:hypothetical protein [Clostridia bacterium]